EIQATARERSDSERPFWPMLVLRTPKGWSRREPIGGPRIEGTSRSHQGTFAQLHGDPEQLAQLEAWMRSYRPEELFDDAGRPAEELRELVPVGTRRMGANPHANGGLLLKDLRLPDFKDYAVDVAKPGAIRD